MINSHSAPGGATIDENADRTAIHDAGHDVAA
jgi:hypothetical protein